MIGGIEVYTPTSGIVGQRAEIAIGLVAEKAKAQTTLTLEGTVTSASIASRGTEEAGDVALEIHLRGLLRRVQGARKCNSDHKRR
jgi:hypothetical protein